MYQQQKISIMTTQVKINGKTRKVLGTQKSKIDGRLFLKIGNELYAMKYATSVDGTPLNESMFFDENENLNEIKEVLMWCNGWSVAKRDGVWSDLLADTQILAEDLANDGKKNSFIANVCQSVRKYSKCSEKQAYIIAKYASKNGISFNNY